MAFNLFVGDQYSVLKENKGVGGCVSFEKHIFKFVMVTADLCKQEVQMREI